jgi:hypothetical protein
LAEQSPDRVGVARVSIPDRQIHGSRL